MAGRTQALPVAFIPEQPLIAAVRHDVVNDSGRRQDAVLHAFHAEWV